MAATYAPDVSLSINGLGWHFGNWHDQELAEETAAGLEELGATELAGPSRQAYVYAKDYWAEFGSGTWTDGCVAKGGCRPERTTSQALVSAMQR